MFIARQRPTGIPVFAWEAQPEEGPFSCPECNAEVILKKGEKVAAHFAHISDAPCRYGAGESEEHVKGKAGLYRSLRNHPDVSECEIEHKLGQSRADISIRILGLPVAVEYQCSPLSPDDFRSRMAAYTKSGVCVLWVIPWRSDYELTRCAPTRWQRYIHALYFKRAYCWRQGCTLQPVHWGPYYLKNGKLSKRYRTPYLGPILDIVVHFADKFREDLKRGTYHLPSGRLWADTVKCWWPKEPFPA